MAKSKISKRAYRRQMLRQANQVTKQELAITGTSDEIYQRQVPQEDLFSGMYAEHRIMLPPYSFANLRVIYEESDILQACVEAMFDNIDGFGYKLAFLGDDIKEKESSQAAKERVKLQNFFDRCNEHESFTTVRKDVRADLEIFGNGAFEVVRNRRKEISMMFHAPFDHIRLSALTGRAVTVPVSIMRDGKMITIRRKKYFRRYVQVKEDGKTLRWFKELGDPRIVDAITGEFTTTPKVPASEIWHFKLGTKAYGIPRWIGPVLSVLGRRNAQYVNWDLFENQGIPPVAVLVSGGVLTDESLEDLENIIRGARGLTKFNRILILEATPEGLGLEDKGNAKLELKNLAEYRREDQMFDRYLKSTEQDVRHRYRLPPLYIGAAETFTHATAKAAQTVAEEQVFIPERSSFDEQANIKLLKDEFGIELWEYRSRGPRIVGSAEISKGVEVFTKVGAFSINHAIERANEAFGLEMSKLDKPWADYPMPIVNELLKAGKLLDIDDIAKEVEENTGKLPVAAGPKQLLLPQVTEKALQSDIFSEPEKALYRLLVGIQTMIEKVDTRDDE